MTLYPIKFQPIFKYRIWGGEKLKSELNKVYDDSCIGESWEISNVENDETLVASGNLKGKSLTQLILTYKEDFLGQKNYENFGTDFPLLIKFLDTAKPLSIQVHPSNEIAKKRHNSFGKNEMWYVIEADDNAEIIVGFDKNVDKNIYKQHLEEGTLTNIMHYETVQKGDTFYIPTGRVHAIGKGILLAEIQQTSDVTYRVYDYNRVDAKTGEKRELHTDLAEDVIDFNNYDNYKTDYSTKKNVANTLVHSPYFKTNILPITGEISKDNSKIDSFIIYMCVKGSTKITYNSEVYHLNYGETILIPACINHLKIEGNSAELLEIYI